MSLEIQGSCAAAYATVYHLSSVNQALIAMKSRLSKRELTIPRLEITATHVAANVASNIKIALRKQNFKSKIGWTDSAVVLHWLSDNKTYKVFIAKRVKQILKHKYIESMYVPTKQNPADISS